MPEPTMPLTHAGKSNASVHATPQLPRQGTEMAQGKGAEW